MHTEHYNICLTLLVYRRRPDWWREIAYAGTKQLYQPAPQPEPVVYVIPVTDILLWYPTASTALFPLNGKLLRATIPGECVIVRIALEAEVSYTRIPTGNCLIDCLISA